MREKLTSFLILEGFTPLNSNLPELRVFLRREFSNINVIFTIDLKQDFACTREQYDIVHKTALELLQKQGVTMDMHILTLCLTEDVRGAAALCGHDHRAWLIDKGQERLVVPEGKLQDFYGMRTKLENFMYQPDEAVREVKRLEEIAKKEIRAYEKKRKSPVPYVTIAIVVLNLLAFVPALMFGNPVFDMFALDVRALEHGQWYRLITAAFLHDSLYQLLTCMMMFYVIASLLEPILGRIQFVVLYLAGILAGSLSFLFYSVATREYAMTYGSGAAICSILGAMIVVMILQPWKYRKGLWIRLLMFAAFVAMQYAQGGENPLIKCVPYISGLCFGTITMLLFILVRRTGKEGKKHED